MTKQEHSSFLCLVLALVSLSCITPFFSQAAPKSSNQRSTLAKGVQPEQPQAGLQVRSGYLRLMGQTADTGPIQLVPSAPQTGKNQATIEELTVSEHAAGLFELRNGRMVQVAGPVTFEGVISIATIDGMKELRQPHLIVDADRSIARISDGSTSLELVDVDVQYNAARESIIISADIVRLSNGPAEANLGGAIAVLEVDGSQVSSGESEAPAASRSAIGPDVIVSDLPFVRSYGNTLTCSESGFSCTVDADCKSCSSRNCPCDTDDDCKTCSLSGNPCFVDLDCDNGEVCQSVESCEVSGETCDVSVSAFSVATTSCNIGDAEAIWNASTNQHPVITQNMYRLKDGKFEQIGLAWVKHGISSVNFNSCGGNCQRPPDWTNQFLYVGCSDPYSSALNGQQDLMGPRSLVNPFNGAFPFPYTQPCDEPDGFIDRRLQVKDSDLADYATASYFVEGHYVTPDDALAGNGDNNVSYRLVTVSPDGNGGYTATESGSPPTQQQQAAIRAWGDVDPAVEEFDIRVPGEGLLICAVKVTDLISGEWEYEYALQNISSDRAVRSFSLPLPEGALVTNVGFHDVHHHSGEPYDRTDWAPTITTDSITWATDTHQANPSANALRWGTLYNFRFKANVPPEPSTLTLALFNPGALTEVNATIPGPALDLIDCNDNGLPDDCDINCSVGACAAPCGESDDCNGNGVPDECESDCQPNGIADECDVSSGTSEDCNLNTVPDECEQDCDGDGIITDCDDVEDTDGDGVDDCSDLCPTTVMEFPCDCPPEGECCYPPHLGGFCIGPLPPEDCLAAGAIPECNASELCRDGCLVGDADNDGMITLLDAAVLNQCFSGPITGGFFVPPSADCLRVFDYNGDGAVDLEDLQRLADRLTGP